MTTLGEVMISVARRVGIIWEGPVTAGSAAALSDPGLGLLGYVNDAWKGGEVWLTSGSPGVGRPIKSSVGASGLITADTAFPGTPAVGSGYGVMFNKYTRGLILSSVNTALAVAGQFVGEDTSLVGDGQSLDFALPAVARLDLRQVWVASQAAAPYGWELMLRWRKLGNTLEFTCPPPAMPIRLVYVGCCPWLWKDEDVIDARIHPELIAAVAAEYMARTMVGVYGEGDGRAQLVIDCRRDAYMAHVLYRADLPARTCTVL